MKKLRPAILLFFRIAGITLLILGILFWTGRALSLLQLHMGLGMIFVVAYLYLVATAKLDPAKITLAVALGFLVPVFGILQTRLLLGEFHWVIRVTHLVIAIAAMGIVDRTSKRLAAMQQG